MSEKGTSAMWRQLMQRCAQEHLGLQAQIRGMLVGAILDGQLPPGAPLPSSRELAEELGVARNTVVLAYQQLADEGYILSRERRGNFVNPEALAGRVAAAPRTEMERAHQPDWRRRLHLLPSAQRNIAKPANWQSFPYPFLYGQFDTTLFPTADWRECCMKTLSVLDIRHWAPDQIARDDDSLVQQICSRVLPRRGVWASPDQVVVTVGAQHALYLVADLLVREGTRVAIEDPGYPDARNLFASRTSNVVPVPVDTYGLPCSELLRHVDYVYATPSHQCPTGVTMPLQRRQELLSMAQERDFVVIEDDFESENRFDGEPTPALKSLDRSDRVIYVGSLSKGVAPGLRIGYVVASAELIAEIRALRRLMLRHPSAFISRAFALFLSLGHHDAQLRRVALAQRERYAVLEPALRRHLPECRLTPVTGGGSCWLQLPDGISAGVLAEAAAARGVLIEPGDVFFHAVPPPAGCVRLGFQSIPAERIEPGIRVLGEVLHGLMHPAR